MNKEKYTRFFKKILFLLVIVGVSFGIYQGVKMTILAPKIVADATGEYLFRTVNAKDFEAGFGLNEETPNIVFQRNGTEIVIELPSRNMTWQQIGKNLQASPAQDYTYNYSVLTDWKGKALGLKAEIILQEPPHLSHFVFPITLKNLEPQKIEDTWHFFDKSGQSQFYIPKPFMIDAKGEKSEQIEIVINTLGNFIKITPSRAWLDDPQRAYPVTIDPTIRIPEEPIITILTVHSHPQAGDNWTVSFETKGTADLTITPDDQVSIDDLDFVFLKCGAEDSPPQILENDVIFYSDWECQETGEVTHLVNVARNHILKFQFANQTKYAHNSPGWVTPTSTNDPWGAGWADDDNTIDGDTGTFATNQYSESGHELEFLHAALNCDKVRIWGMTAPDDPGITVDVYYGFAWHEIHSGAFTESEYYEISIGSTESVTKARIHSNAGTNFYVWEFEFNEVEANQAPTAPTNLYSNNTNAQAGKENPSGITDGTPVFSAVYNDPNADDIANKYQIQVATSSDFATSTRVWDSDASGTSMSNCSQGDRCQDVEYASTSLALDGSTYYWRIKFWDDEPSEGAWSTTTDYFIMASRELDTSTNANTLRLGADRHTFYDGTNYWAFYIDDSSHIVYEKSSDGTTWSGTATDVATSTTYSSLGLWEDSGDIYLAYSDGSNSYVRSYGEVSLGWVSPTGFNDPEGEWLYEDLAYDEDTETNAWGAEGFWGELLHSAITCDKVRFWVYSYISMNYVIEVHKDGTWVEIYDGVPAHREWVEQSFASGSVDEARIQCNNAGTFLFEFDFNEVGHEWGAERTVTSTAHYHPQIVKDSSGYLWRKGEATSSVSASVTDSFTEETLISTTTQLEVDTTAGQVKLATTTPPEDCACEGTGFETHTVGSDTYYVDCNYDKCWSPTAASTKNWDGAVSYCSGLDHAGFDDWTLPSCTSGATDSGCDLWALCDSDSCDGKCWPDTEGQSTDYWSSTEYDSSAFSVYFNGCFVNIYPKSNPFYVRCVREQ